MQENPTIPGGKPGEIPGETGKQGGQGDLGKRGDDVGKKGDGAGKKPHEHEPGRTGEV